MKVRDRRHMIGTLLITTVVACSHDGNAPTVPDATVTRAPDATMAQAGDGDTRAAMSDIDASRVATDPTITTPAVGNDPEQAQLAERSAAVPVQPATASDGPAALKEPEAQSGGNSAGQADANNAPREKATNAGTANLGKIVQPVTMKGYASISNNDPSLRVYFATSPLSYKWENQYLDPQETREFACTVGANEEQCLFAIRTGNKPILKYWLLAEERYQIEWDGHKGLWDLHRTPTD